MTKTATRTQVIAATAFLAVSSVAAAAAFKMDRSSQIRLTPSASSVCMNIQQLPAIGTSNEAQYNTIQRYKMVCESVGCNLSNLEQRSFSTTGYNPSRQYNAGNKRCIGTPRRNACPAVGSYILSTLPTETGRSTICQSFSGCQFNNGQDSAGLPNSGINDTCTRLPTAMAPSQQGQNIVPSQQNATAQAPGSEPRNIVQNCPPPESMVAWWPGDGHARDVVGGFDGLLTGDTSYTPGREGQAFSFSGGYQSGVVINPGDSSTLNFTGNHTVMGWIYKSDISSVFGSILDRNYGGPHLWLNNNIPQFYNVQPDRSDAGGNFISDDQRVIRENEWTHFAGVVDGTTTILYRGGALVGSYTWPSISHPTDFSLWSMGGALIGKLDNVMAFNRALSGTEIRNLSEGNCVPALPAPLTSCIAAPSGMIAWWPGEGNAEDISGNHDGQLIGTVTYAEGKVGQSFWNSAVNRSSSDGPEYVEIPYTSDLALSGEFTIMAWVKAQRPTGEFFNRGDNYKFRFGANGPEFRTYANALMGRTGAPYGYRWPAEQWVHLTGVKERERTRFYVDGVLSEFINSVDVPTDNNLSLIIAQFTGADNSGGVDEAMMFNRALTHAEISNIVRAGEHGVCRP